MPQPPGLTDASERQYARPTAMPESPGSNLGPLPKGVKNRRVSVGARFAAKKRPGPSHTHGKVKLNENTTEYCGRNGTSLGATEKAAQ